MSLRARVLLMALVVLLAGALTSVFVVRARQEEQRRLVPTAATARDRALDLGEVLDAPHIVFRSTAPGPTYGRLAAVPLADPDGRRSVSTMSCDRVYATATSGICLAAARGAINGIPSGARLSADGTWAATTAFISGHGYGTIDFSTETVVVERSTGRVLGNLEKTFSTIIDGHRNAAADLNIWGVTFAPGPRPNRFYATVATGGTTWLAEGDLAARTLTALRPDAECPSLSPDGRRLVYKKRAGSSSTWRYHVLDLATGVERPLVETRSVDDQADWLDDNHVLYGVTRPGAAESDVWVADVRPRAGRPRVFLPAASSPAVVHGAASSR